LNKPTCSTKTWDNVTTCGF